ncbi:MAG TPA: hypothetical protein VE684_00195 [Crenalkalicoccus sp.]|jgi:hypothetical protein|nr:hypothetical protein [Crenalkalicoccus sp.]
MNQISPVTMTARERIAREFDERGPEACVAEVIEELKRHNPELLDIARRCAASLGDRARIMLGFSMFYRLLIAPAVPSDAPSALNPLPCVTPETRDLIVSQIDRDGAEAFTMRIIEELERNNPELLQMAHNFARRQQDYLGAMQGLALFYKSVLEAGKASRNTLH